MKPNKANKPIKPANLLGLTGLLGFSTLLPFITLWFTGGRPFSSDSQKAHCIGVVEVERSH